MKLLKKLGFEIALLTALVICITASSFSAFAAQCRAVRENTLRLHILANSDSEEDQELKLRVRDRILEKTGDLFAFSETLSETRQRAEKYMPEIVAEARKEIAAAGFEYNVSAELTTMFFETRSYDDVTLPAGKYSAVRISIGKAEGKNWWCVLFPPLCLPSATDEAKSSDALEPMTGTGKKYKIKFKIVELFENFFK